MNIDDDEYRRMKRIRRSRRLYVLGNVCVEFVFIHYAID